MFREKACGEIETCKAHSATGLFEWCESSIKVEHYIIRVSNDVFVKIAFARKLDEIFLGMSITVVETRCFKHKTFKTNDCLGGHIEGLYSC